jgi:anti-sigma factor RsiW
MVTLDIAANDLDAYALDRFAEPDAAPVEEHLLVCGECRARLGGWDEYVRAMRVLAHQAITADRDPDRLRSSSRRAVTPETDKEAPKDKDCYDSNLDPQLVGAGEKEDRLAQNGV